MRLEISPGLNASCRKSPERIAWLERLPGLLGHLLSRWKLTLDAPLDGEDGSCSHVSAVLRADGTPAVLKLAMPHMEGRDEIHGLRFWNGDPTVRIMESDDALGAMLLERCQPGTTLRALDERDQDVVISSSLLRLWRSPTPPHSFRPLSDLTEYWSNETLQHAEQWPDPGLVRAGLQLLKDLPRTATRSVLLATDLHAGNVLRAKREPWLVIDPKPFVGDPAYDGTQHLFNCGPRLFLNPGETIRRFAGRLGIDYGRLRLWTFARATAEPRDDWGDPDRNTLARAVAP